MLGEPLASTPFRKRLYPAGGWEQLSLDVGCVGPSVEVQRQAGSKFAWLGKPMQWSGFSQISASVCTSASPKLV